MLGFEIEKRCTVFQTKRMECAEVHCIKQKEFVWCTENIFQKLRLM